KFEMRWVKLKARQSPCPAFSGMDTLELPVRHGEGRFSVYEPFGKIRPENGEKTLLRLFNDKQVILQYANAQGADTQHFPENPNGSLQAIAGICDKTGRIFGLMPHPEGYLRFENHPLWHRQADALLREDKAVPTEGQGMRVFQNLARYVEEKIR
ncbi:MAG TPA: phosphoribosylformylglycinamidine synthase subunit PurQ, partial [Candidatus Norongarragalinales archaeon]|nr:phosphoribosylformylglycinamidine synthase subunit PurQ [Candidatus Norongarragalinales archaeon]